MVHQSRSADVSIIIPVYNGAFLLNKHVPPFLDHLRARKLIFEVIIVDDGSSDRAATANFARTHSLHFIQLPHNSGKGAALRAGFAQATGKLQVFTDADIPFNYKNVDEFINTLNADPAQLLIGDRTNPASVYYDQSTFARKVGSKVISILAGSFFLKGIRDTQCGLKGMGWEVAHKLFPGTFINRFAIDIELIYLAKQLDIPIKKMPVQLRYNDKSTVRAADGLRLLVDMYTIKQRHGK